MTPQERFLTALRGEEPDEVPVSLAICGWKNGRRDEVESSTVTRAGDSSIITRRITVPQSTLTSRELIDQPE